MLYSIKKNVLLLVMLLTGCSTNTVLYCPPDERPVVVYSEPSELYKDVITSYDINIKGLKTTLEEYEAEFSAGEIDVKKEITLLQQKLDQNNIKHKNNLKTISISQQINPCDIEANKRLFTYLNNINKHEIELENIKAKLNNKLAEGNPNKSAEIIKEINTKPEIDLPGIDAPASPNTTKLNINQYQQKKKTMT